MLWQKLGTSHCQRSDNISYLLVNRENPFLANIIPRISFFLREILGDFFIHKGSDL